MIRAGAAVVDPGLTRYASALLILAVAALLMAPEIASGVSPSDSLQYNIVWTEQFRNLFREGSIYPRWLPASWDGLGSPTFFIYPPLFFWTASMVDLLTFQRLSIETLIPATSLVVLAASGLAMKAWLSSVVRGGFPLFGAILYMAAPYHLQDIYGRGAMAETCAYAVLPLLVLGISRLSEGNARYAILSALSYSALILAHLPTALLVSLFLLPGLVLLRARTSSFGFAGFIAYASAVLILGVGVAAFYLLPALSFTEHISYTSFFGNFYQPQSWFFWRPDVWPRQAPVLSAMLLCAAALPMALHVAAMSWRASQSEALLWSSVVLLSVVMVSGVLPFLWHLPLLSKVQFPFRFLVILEFALVTMVVVARPRLTRPLILCGGTLWGIALGQAIVLIAVLTNVDEAAKARRIDWTRTEYRDAPEYLPPQVPVAFGKEPGIPDPGAIVLPTAPAVRLEPNGAASAVRQADGGARVEIEAPAGGVVTLRRFYFPHWKIIDASGKDVEGRPSEAGLLSWTVPPGRSTFHILSATTPSQHLGGAISGLALLLLGAAFLLLRRRNNRVNDIFTNPALETSS